MLWELLILRKKKSQRRNYSNYKNNINNMILLNKLNH
jgi:hypothetical protein